MTKFQKEEIAKKIASIESRRLVTDVQLLKLKIELKNLERVAEPA